VNSCVTFTPISADVGETEIEGGVGTTVSEADADLVMSATEVAVTVTVAFAGTVDGGVYVVGASLAVLVGATVPHAGEHAEPPCVRVQVTPLLAESF
jgi:hypothetical protein